MACLDERAALAILDGRLAGPEREALDVHLDSCEWCRRLVAEIARGTQPAAGGDREVETRRTIGRFIVEHELGRGSMGIVYAAYDPELDRRVALKVLRATGASGDAEEHELEARLLREARTMARLAHPNVVPVHEVGREGAALFLAMELIEGDTLRDWLADRPRTAAEVLGVLIGAARGLAAAHAEGLVHRDFKPENVLVGADGRARVTDFGLARVARERAPSAAELAQPAGELTRTGALVGTPAYMAPEQITPQRGAVDARGDQFSFCVVAYEALYGLRPFAGSSLDALVAAIRAGELREVPRRHARCHRAIVRGLAADPAARFPSMSELVARLEYQPFMRRPPVVAVGAALAAGAAAVIATVALRAPAAAPCSGAARELAAIWNDDQRHAIDAAFARTHSPLAADAFARTAIELDRYTTSWIAQHEDSCEATRVRGEASDAVLDRRMACLADRRDELRALVELFATADASTVEHAATAVSALASPASCAAPGDDDPVTSPEAAALRADLHHAVALAKLGKNDEAIAALSPVIAGAGALPRLRAEAQYWRGLAKMNLRQDKQAAGDLEEAAYAAQAAKRDDLAASAGSLLVAAYADAADLEHARSWVRYADAAVARLPADSELHAEHAAHVAWLELQAGQLADAEAQARKAVEAGCRGAAFVTAHCAHLDVLASVLFRAGKLDEALALYRRNLELVVQESGPAHPDVARLLDRIGGVLEKLGRHDEALQTFERALAIPTSDAALASLLDNSATTLMTLGRLPEAEARMRRALALHERVQGADHPEVAICLVNLANILELEHHGSESIPLRERALHIFETKLGPQHPLVAATLVQTARALVVDHRPRDAEPLLVRALAIQPDDAYTLAVLGGAQLDAHEPTKAVATLEHAQTLAAGPHADADLIAGIRENLADAKHQLQK